MREATDKLRLPGGYSLESQQRDAQKNNARIIREERMRQGLTQADLARNCRVTVEEIVAIEDGTYNRKADESINALLIKIDHELGKGMEEHDG